MVSQAVRISISQTNKLDLQKLEITAGQGSHSASLISLLKHWIIKILKYIL